MTLEEAKAYAKANVARTGHDQYIYVQKDGKYQVTESDSYWHEDAPVGWFDTKGEWHYPVGVEPATPHFWCVFDDSGLYARGYTTREEAEAFEEGLEYCQLVDLTTFGIFPGITSDEAFAAAKTAHPTEDAFAA